MQRDRERPWERRRGSRSLSLSAPRLPTSAEFLQSSSTHASLDLMTPGRDRRMVSGGLLYSSSSSIGIADTASRSSTTNSANRPQYKAAIINWFLGLSVEERVRVLSFEDKEAARLLKRMYQTKMKEGEGLFFSAEDEIHTMFKGIEDDRYNFCFGRLSLLSKHCHCFYSDWLLQVDKELEDNIRLCDTREYLDTVSVSREFVKNGKHFLNVMEIASRGRFLDVPCYVYYDEKQKIWVWDSPTWFQTMGFYTLGQFIAYKLEKVFWMRYWESHHLDPRKPGIKKGRTYTFPSPCHWALLSKTYLVDFWISMSGQERKRIVGSISSLVESALLETSSTTAAAPPPTVASSRSLPSLGSGRYYSSASSTYSSSSSSTSSSAPTRRKTSGASITGVSRRLDEYPQLLSALVELSSEEKTLELLFKDADLVSHEKTFIEMLYFSPLHTAGTPIDLVLRGVGVRIQRAYTEKLEMDLIFGEENQKKLARASQEEATRRRKKKKTKPSATASPNTAAAPATTASRDEARLSDLPKLTPPPQTSLHSQSTATCLPIVRQIVDDIVARSWEALAARRAGSTSPTPAGSSQKSKKKKNKKKARKRRQLSAPTLPTLSEIHAAAAANNSSTAASAPASSPSSPPTSPRSLRRKSSMDSPSEYTANLSQSSSSEDLSRMESADSLASATSSPLPLTLPLSLSLSQNYATSTEGATVPPTGPLPKSSKEAPARLQTSPPPPAPPLSSSATAPSPSSPPMAPRTNGAAAPFERTAVPVQPIVLSRRASLPPHNVVVPPTAMGPTALPQHPVAMGPITMHPQPMHVPPVCSPHMASALKLAPPLIPPRTSTSPIEDTVTMVPMQPMMSFVAQSQPLRPVDEGSYHAPAAARAGYITPPTSPTHTATRGYTANGTYYVAHPPPGLHRSPMPPPTTVAPVTMISPPSSPPPQPAVTASAMSFTERLDKEIRGYVEYIKSVIHTKMKADADALLSRLRNIVNEIWPSAEVKVYGSFATALCIPSSDLDVVICRTYPVRIPVAALTRGTSAPPSVADDDEPVPGSSPPARMPAPLRDTAAAAAIAAGGAQSNTYVTLSPFQMLVHELRRQVWVQNLQPIETARMPVIKITSIYENIPTDITFDSDPTLVTMPTSDMGPVGMAGMLPPVHHRGLDACQLVKEFKERLPALEPLVLILKQFLYERGLNNAYTGGLSSYCLVLMVIAFLHSIQLGLDGARSHSDEDDGAAKKKNLGALLVEFLDLYGKGFDYSTTAITIDPLHPHVPIEAVPGLPPAPLVIIDPFDETNNIGYNAFSMWRVKAAFEYAHDVLTSPIMTGYTTQGLLQRILMHMQPTERVFYNQYGLHCAGMADATTTHAAYTQPLQKTVWVNGERTGPRRGEHRSNQPAAESTAEGKQRATEPARSVSPINGHRVNGKRHRMGLGQSVVIVDDSVTLPTEVMSSALKEDRERDKGEKEHPREKEKERDKIEIGERKRDGGKLRHPNGKTSHSANKERSTSNATVLASANAMSVDRRAAPCK